MDGRCRNSWTSPEQFGWERIRFLSLIRGSEISAYLSNPYLNLDPSVHTCINPTFVLPGPTSVIACADKITKR